MPFVSGYLRIRDPGAHPDQGLPGAEGPVDPGYGIRDPITRVWVSRLPPPGVWPPPVPAHPIVPAPPGTPPGAIWPPPSPSHPWQPPTGGGGAPPHPDQGLPPGGGGGAPPRPDQGLPPNAGQPGTPTHPIAGGGEPSHPIATPPDKFWIVAGIPGYGWRYVCVQPHPAHPIDPVRRRRCHTRPSATRR